MRLYCAATEVTDTLAAVESGLMRYAFLSYFLARTKTTGQGRQVVETVLRNTSTIIDSGAHSFFTSSDSAIHSAGIQRRKGKGPGDPEAYFAAYMDWLDEFTTDQYFAELDIGEIVGQRRVEQWRDRLAQRGLLRRCITVYHPAIMTRDDYSRMIRDTASGWIAVEGIRTGMPPLPYSALVREAYEAGVRVHGFAMVKQNILRTIPFYSVDSSSWKSAGIYGTVPLSTGFAKMSYTRVSGKTRDRVQRQAQHAPGGFAASIQQGRGMDFANALNIEAVKSINTLQEDLTALWEARGIRWEEKIARWTSPAS